MMRNEPSGWKYCSSIACGKTITRKGGYADILQAALEKLCSKDFFLKSPSEGGGRCEGDRRVGPKCTVQG